MIIKQFSLTNFGKHASITFDSNASVVGMLGPNGVGKSTILDAIEFAITGEARDPLPSYVRHGEGNASVSLTFTKNGMEGYIFRQFGKTPKRVMTWDNKKITSAKEVDSTMSAIFGADKKAIANAVFINQGMLDKILFSGDVERRELFIRLVNMAFCEKHKNMLEGKIKKLQNTIIDLGPALDAASAQVRESEAACLQTKQISDAMIDYTSDHARCDAFILAERDLRSTMALMANVETEQLGNNAQLATLLQSWNAPTFEAAQALMQNMEDGLRTMDRTLAEWKSIRSELIHYDSIGKEIRDRLAVMNTHTTRLQELNPHKLTLLQMEEGIQQAAGVIEQYDAYEGYRSELRTAEQQIQTYQETVKGLIPPPESLEQLNTRHEQLAQQSALVDTLQASLAQRVELAACMQPDGSLSGGNTTCAKCGLQVANPEALRPEALEQAGHALTTLRKQISELTQVYLDYKSAWEAHDKMERELKAAISHWTTQANAAKAKINSVSEAVLASFAFIEQHRSNHQTLQAMKIQVPEIEKSISDAQADINRWMENRKQYALALANQHQRAEFTNDKEQELSRQANENHAKAVTMRREFGEMNRLHAMLATLTTQMQQHVAAKARHEQIMAQPLPPVVIELSNTLQGNLEAVKAELNARMEARSQAIGRTQQAQESLKRVKATYEDLARRVASDAEKRKIIEDLVLLKDLMSAEGLPAAVVDYHFRYLAALTQTALNQLDANFSIMIDEERPLSFKFVRLDEPEHVPLPMNKLSGGQRVRLCTAFLIAVQQRLVKEVGLMVLDEPSTHVDQNGVESLAEFLRTLGGQLRNTEIQIFISDHHPALKNCFDKVLELT